jgi:hypothetical protein
MSRKTPLGMRDHLINEVRVRLCKKFMECGFSFFPLIPQERSRELRVAFPLGRLKRMQSDHLDLVEFQFDKHGKPSFVVNFGRSPNEGVSLPWGVHLNQDELDVAALPEAYRLYSSSCYARWFQSGFFSPTGKRSIVRIVDQAVFLSDEILMWFENQTIGRHMRRFGWVPKATVS